MTMLKRGALFTKLNLFDPKERERLRPDCDLCQELIYFYWIVTSNRGTYRPFDEVYCGKCKPRNPLDIEKALDEWGLCQDIFDLAYSQQIIDKDIWGWSINTLLNHRSTSRPNYKLMYPDIENVIRKRVREEAIAQGYTRQLKNTGQE